MKKRVLVLLIAVLTLVSAYAGFAVMIGASTPTPELTLAFANLSFRDSVCIKYAVDANVADVKLLVWTSPESEYTVGTHDGEVTAYYNGTVSGKAYKIFDYPLAAKQMADVIYVRAYTRADNVDYYSDVVKYSVLQYAYNKLGKTATASTDAELKSLLTKMLDYGAAAQLYLNDYKADRLANASWYQVKLTAGVLDDGFAHGLYLPGDKVTLTAPATDENGTAFGYWADSSGASVADTAVFELTVGNKNEVYTPVYGEAEDEYSEGLEFESNGDGTCILLGMGDFDGTELVIPPVYEGDNVTEIDRRAFLNEAITLVKIPATVTDIGNYAFNGCSALTDVYYDGTEDEWNNNVSIGSNNAPLENATKHFKTPAQPELPENNYTEPTIEVRNATASVGDEVEVVIVLYNNPGLSSMKLKVNFDDAALSLESIVYNDSIGGMSQPPQTLDSPTTLNWFNGASNTYGDFVYATLTFSVSENAVAGDYEIEISYNPEDVYNLGYDNIDFDIAHGSVTVS